MKRKYKVITDPFVKEKMETLLNQMSEQGWELTCIGTIRGQIGEYISLFVFKREIPEPKTDTDIELGLDRPIFNEGEPPVPEAPMTAEETLDDPRR